MFLKDICSECLRNCCEFLKKPKDYKIDDRCKHYSNGKCLLHNSNNWRDRLKNGRTLLCELFPAVISSPLVRSGKLVVKITANENCHKACEILGLESERNKVKEILDFIFKEIKSDKAINIPWFQYHLFKKCFKENKNKRIEIIFQNF